MESSTKQAVRQFYDRVGWQEVSEGVYQNASYEDLRPVSRSYIHRCHLKVRRFLPESGRLLLDAGSGPIQYPEYLTYSENYHRRVCVDISIVALQEARKRINEHGWFVVADVANMPFCNEVFDGIVSLHTLHHVSVTDQEKSYHEFHRLMKPGKSAVVVNGWSESPLMHAFMPLVLLSERVKRRLSRAAQKPVAANPAPSITEKTSAEEVTPTGTFVEKLNARRLREMLSGMEVEIRCWRSVSVRFLRALIHPVLLGRLWLGLLYVLEEVFPRFFGEQGQYPLVVMRKHETKQNEREIMK